MKSILVNRPIFSSFTAMMTILVISIESVSSNILAFSDIDDKFVSSGYFHTCALENRPGVEIGGGIKCWGDNRKGQTNSPPGIYKQISCGKFFSCAISFEERLSCWGDIEGVLPDGRFVQVSVGQNHACAIQKDGKVYCWGRNDFGETSPPPHYYSQVSAGNGHTCGIRMNGSVECWGNNQSNQSNPPDLKFKQISVGLEKHACGITVVGGNIKCWGANSRGHSASRTGPFMTVSSGMKSTCGLHTNHTVECWGQYRHPIPSGTKSNTTSYQQITLGMDHACAIDKDRKIHCWNSGPDLGAHIVPLGFVVAKR